MANGGNINYNVRFNTDTSGLNKATQEIQKIQDSLKAVRTINIRAAMAGKAPEEAAKLKKELTEAKEAASLVESALKKSFNTKLDTFNITNFKNELTKAGTSISEIGQKLMKSGAKGAAAFRDIETQVGKVNLKVKQSNKLLDEMATTMMNSIKWGVTSAIWNNMTGAVEKAWGFAKKLDSSLNDIRIVTEKSAEDMEKFAIQANKAAKTLGSSTAGYTEASLIYYQQGLSDAEVQARTETTLKAANVTGQSAAEVSEQLTAVWNGYKVSAQEAELYVDKLSAVAATTAADLEELSTGMSKVASAASIMGVDIDQLNAQLATVVSVTRQAPEAVGTAFKTIYARMGDIEAGLDTETSLGEYTKKMNEMGFNVLDTNGKLRDMGSVIEEIGNKWTSLSREQQVALSQIMAGTRQYNNLLALFDNWDMYSKSIETSKNATGALQKQQDIYMESMEAHLQKLSTEGERVYNNLFNADTVNPLIDALTSLVSLIADFVDGIGGIGPLLLMIGSMGTKALSKQIGEGLSTSITNFRNAKKNAEELASQYQLLDSISKDFSNDLVGQQAKIDKSINSLARKGLITQERADELRSFSAALGEAGKRIDNLKIKQEEYNKVAKEGKENALQLDKDVQDQSNYTSTATLLERISTQRKTVEIDDNVQLEDAIPAYRALNKELDRRNEKLDQTREKLDQTNISLKQNIANNQSLANIISQQGDISKAYQSPDFQHQVGNINKNIKDIQEQYEAFKKDLSDEEKESFKGALLRYQAHLQKLREAGSAGTLTSEQIKNFQKYATEVQQEFEKAITNGFNDGLENAEAAIDNVRQAAQQAAEGSLEQNQKDLNSAEEEAQGLQKDFNDEIANEQLKQKITLITELVGAVGQLASAMTMVSNIVNIAMDDSLSVEEKFKQIIPLLIAAAPMLISSFKGIQASLAGLFPSGVAAAGGLTATATASTAAGAAATGAAGGFTALWEAMGPIGWIILGVTAAVIGLTAIINSATNAYNADAAAAEKAAEAYEKSTQAVNEAKTAYENLKNTIDKYDSAIEKLDALATGTDIFRDALEEANSQAKELISTYGILSDQYFYNARGAITFKEGVLEALEIQKKEQIALAERQATIAKWESQRATLKSNTTDTIRAVQKDAGKYDLLEGTGAEWLEIPDRILRGIFTAGLSELQLHLETQSSFNEDMLKEVVSAIEKSESANGKLTDSILASLPYSQKQKDALKENSKAIEQLVETNKQLLDSQKNEFKNLIRQSLQTTETFNKMDAGSQNYLIDLIANKYGSYDEFLKQNNYDAELQSFKNQSLETLGAMFAELRGMAGAKVEGSEVKLYNSSGQLSDITYSVDQMAGELASEKILNNMSTIMLPFVDKVQDVANKEIALLGKNSGLLTQYLAEGEIDLTNFTSKEYAKLLELLAEGDSALEQFFDNIDLSGTSFKNTSEAVEAFKKQIQSTNFSSIFEREADEAKKDVSQGNNTIDKLLKGETLGEDDLAFLSKMQNKYKTLQDIWVEELWYNQENISKLKAVLEIEEDIVSSTNRAASAWESVKKAQQDYQTASEEYSDKQRSTADSESNLQNVIQDLKIATATYNNAINDSNNILYQLENATSEDINNLKSDLYRNLLEYNDMKWSEAGARQLQMKLSDWSAQRSDPLFSSAANEKTTLDSLFNRDLSQIDKNAYAYVFKKIQDEYKIGRKGDRESIEAAEKKIAANKKAESDALNKKYQEMIDEDKAIQNALTADLEIRIANKEDLLTNVDDVIDRATNIKTAIESIGDGFKVAADKSDELLRIFPELAAGAKVLSDGTIELNELTVDSVLDGEADILDAKRNTTVATLQNKIKELDLSIETDKKQLEEVQNTAAEEFNIYDYLNNTYEDFTSDEIKADTKQAQTEIANDGISTKAIINNWEQKTLAAAKYAEIAAAAIKDPASVAEKVIDFSEYQAKVKIKEDFSSVNTDLTDEEKEKQIAERNKRLKEQFEAYLQQRIDLSEQERAEYLLAISDIYSNQNEIAAATQNNIDLLDDIIDRYHDINILLDDMAKKIERVNRVQEHLVGADWLAAQEQGLKLLEEEIELRRQKQEIQQAEAVELQGHLLADGVKFFDDGSVANYAEIMIAQLAKVNQAKMSGNEDVADAAEKNYEAFKENFERYEELRDDIEDLADEITDMMYEQISKKVEAFTAKLTVELDTTQAQKEWKEFTNQLFISANNALAQITAQSEIYSANRNIATQTTGKYEQIVNEGIKAQALVEGTAEEGTTSVYAQWSEELQQYIFDQAKWQEDMQASQQEAQEAILQILDDVDALGETAIGLLEDTIAAQKEQLAIYDDMNSLLNHSLKLQELFTGEKDYDAKGRIYAEQATISDQKARDAAARRNYALSNIDTYAQAYNEAKQKYDEAVANGTGDVTVLEKQLEITKQAYEDMKNELKESTDDFYSSIEEQIEAAKNVYVNTINKAMADMEKMFTGGKGLSYINEEWDLINKNAERYLDTVNSTYEVQALESKYIKAMDSTSNLSAQKKINKAMEEELKALREKDKLSQYDIDRANKKYELTMKQIALEEAQANKSTMRLRRDAQGNYSYQFVADEDEVSDAQQDLLAAQNDLYNFDKDRYQQTQDDILSIYQEYQQKMLEAAQINDPTERAEKEKLITEQYQQLLLSIAADNETARQNLGMSTTEALQGQYDINRSNFEAMTQGIFDNFSSVAEGMSTNFEMIMSNMITGWDGGVQSMIDKIAGDGPDGFKQQSQNAFNIAQQAAQEFDNKLIEIGENFSGEGNTADQILSDVQEINDKLDSFKTNVLDPTLAAVQELIPDVWAEYKSGVDLAAESMSALATKISSVYTNADSLSKKLTNIASQSPINVEVKYKTTGDATNPSGGYTPNGGGGKDISSQTSSQIGDTVVWGGDYALLNQDANNGNKMTNTSKTWNNIWDALDENERYDWDDAHWDGGDDEVLASAFSKWKITQEIYKDDKVYLYLESERDSSIGGWIPEEDLEEFSKSSEGWSYKTQSFDTGGYTGEWGSEGRMAMLHEKEIVLNQTDTANILDAVAIVRGIGDMLASLQSNWLSNLSSVQVPTISNSETNNSTAQTVNITAEFPNASSATEIEKALKNLVNIASQRAQAFK